MCCGERQDKSSLGGEEEADMVVCAAIMAIVTSGPELLPGSYCNWCQC